MHDTSDRLIGIDSNILLRLLTDDDLEQSSLARQLIVDSREATGIFVSIIVVVETIWVLRRKLRIPTIEIIAAVEALALNADFRFEDQEIVQRAVAAARTLNLDIADCLIALRNRRHGCETTLTFDRKAARLPEFRLLAAE